MAQAALPLTALSEAQRTQALERLEIIGPALEKHVSQAQVARTHHIPPSTIQLWIKRYREKGLAGLANNVTRSDKGKSRKLEDAAIRLIEGLALQTPARSMAAIHRQVTAVAREQGWESPSYDRVRHIIKHLDPALVTMAHQGAAAYHEEFDLLYRRESPHSTECRTVFYTAPVAASPARIERQVLALFAAFSSLIEAANERHHPSEDFLVTRRTSAYIELLIVDEATAGSRCGVGANPPLVS